MLTICYHYNNQNLWKEIPESQDDLSNILAANLPVGATPIRVFESSKDITGDGDIENRIYFIQNAWRYGLSPSDWDMALNLNGSIGRFRGIAPRRRKYVFRIWFPKERQTILYTAPTIMNAIRNAKTAAKETA